MLIYLNPDELRCYLFIVSMGRFDESCNTFDDSFGRIFVPNKIEDANLKVFNMIEGINESRYSQNISHAFVDVSSVVEHITQDKNETMVSVSATLKYMEDIVRVKKILPAILVNVAVSVKRIVRLANTCKTLNV